MFPYIFSDSGCDDYKKHTSNVTDTPNNISITELAWHNVMALCLYFRSSKSNIVGQPVAMPCMVHMVWE